MFLIGTAAIEDDVATASFCCNLKQCKGACCTMPGGRGAPLQDDEIDQVQKAYPSVKEYLSQKSLLTIETWGMVEGTPGNYATACIDGRDCVFVYYEDDIAKCSLERGYEAGKTSWRKPLSCHLFPIRAKTLGQDFVRYEQIVECSPGRKNGKEQGVLLHEFLRKPLIRKFGEKWYDSFIDHCKTILKEQLHTDKPASM